MTIGVKWVYKEKINENGNVEKHKTWLISNRFSPQPRVDYGETFSLVARLYTIRVVLTIAPGYKWKVYQNDVNSTFINGILDEEVYVIQPPWFEVEGQYYEVYKLKKALYDLKKTPRLW